MDERIYLDLAARVRDRRAALGMSQQQMASIAGLSRSSVASIETGRQSVLVHHLYALARALDVAPAELLPEEQRDAARAETATPRPVELFVASLATRPSPRRKGA